MALGFSATLSAKKLLGIFSRSLEIKCVLDALESIRNEDFEIPDLVVQKGICSATWPTFTVSYLPEDGFLIVVANYLGHFTCPLTIKSDIFHKIR